MTLTTGVIFIEVFDRETIGSDWDFSAWYRQLFELALR
jgi:hypothetical protein